MIKSWRNPGILGVGKHRGEGLSDQFCERFSTLRFEVLGIFAPRPSIDGVVAEFLAKLTCYKFFADNLIVVQHSKAAGEITQFSKIAGPLVPHQSVERGLFDAPTGKAFANG